MCHHIAPHHHSSQKLVSLTILPFPLYFLLFVFFHFAKLQPSLSSSSSSLFLFSVLCRFICNGDWSDDDPNDCFSLFLPFTLFYYCIPFSLFPLLLSASLSLSPPSARERHFSSSTFLRENECTWRKLISERESIDSAFSLSLSLSFSQQNVFFPYSICLYLCMWVELCI